MPSVEKSAKSIKDICHNLNYVILIHTKAHQDSGYDSFSRLNYIADLKAKA